MFKVIATDVVVSKGYDNAPALRFSENGDSVRFRIGKKVYDTRAENNTRWVNIAVKGFGEICTRIQKMQLKEGSFIHLIGRLDEEHWTDQASGEQKSQMTIILDEIEYASGGGKPKETQTQNQAANAGTQAVPQNAAPEASANFMGYTPFPGGSFF